MSASPPRVILYAYPFSPFAQKISLLLLFKRIPFSVVAVDSKPPRPQLSEQLGITYRRIPLLAIDGDVLVDTSLIATELEARFPAPQYPTHFPGVGGQAGVGALQAAAMRWWTDKAIFFTAVSLLPSAALDDKAFVEDRKKFTGSDALFDKARMEAGRPLALAKLQSHLADTEELLGGKGPFLLGSDSPSLLDVSVFFGFNWLTMLHPKGPVREVLDPNGPLAAQHPAASAWIKRMQQAVQQQRKELGGSWSNPRNMLGGDSISAEDAAKVLQGATAGRKQVKVEGSDALVSAGWIKQGDDVVVVPDDTGKVPQAGKLIGLNSKTVTLKVSPPSDSGKSVHVHFPRHGYVISKAKGASRL